jgi:hypothetical protein
MPQSDDCRYFIVKHGLDAFEALPNFIWNTRNAPDNIPHRYDQVRRGDRWIGFAYTTSDNRERSLSLVTGFFECVRTREYRKIPVDGLPVSEGKEKAWLIEGKQCGHQPKEPVGVPPLADLLSKPMFHNQGIVPISHDDFDRIREFTLSHQLDKNWIPLLKREPENEQELLAVVVYGHQELGIEEIIRVRKAFPDLFVKIAGGPEKVHLELEVYSEGFFSHGHDKHVSNCQFNKDGQPVAVLCWIDNKPDVKKCVHRVYELRSLIRERKKIVW